MPFHLVRAICEPTHTYLNILRYILYTNKSWVQCAEPAIIYINLAVFRLIFN
jgi:hypothetical protein